MGSSTSTSTSTRGQQAGTSQNVLLPQYNDILGVFKYGGQALAQTQKQWPYFESLLKPFSQQLFAGEGLGQGANYLTNMAGQLGSAANAYNNISPFIQQGGQTAMGALAPIGAEAAQLGQNAQALDPYLSGAYLNGGQQNPYLQNLIQATTAQTLNPIGAQFAAAGRDFSGAYSNAASTALTNALAPINYQYMQQQQANQMQAAQLANQLAGQWGDVSGQIGNVGTNYANIGNLYGNVGQGLGNVAQAYGTLPQLYDQLAMNKANMGAMGTQVLQLMSELPWGSVQNYANLLMPLTSLFGTQQQWNQQYAENSKQNTSTSMFSDRRLKEDIAQVGELFDGTPIYRYRFKGSQAYLIGLMADDVEKTVPQAVGETHGFKTIDYKLATEKAVETGMNQPEGEDA